MNPTLLGFLLNKLTEIHYFHDVQIILTTHSFEVIDILAKCFENENTFTGILTELREGKLLTKEFTADEILDLTDRKAKLDLRLAGILL